MPCAGGLAREIGQRYPSEAWSIHWFFRQIPHQAGGAVAARKSRRRQEGIEHRPALQVFIDISD